MSRRILIRRDRRRNKWHIPDDRGFPLCGKRRVIESIEAYEIIDIDDRAWSFYGTGYTMACGHCLTVEHAGRVGIT